MTRVTLIVTTALVLVSGTLLTSCGRDADDANGKMVGVGYDPGAVQPAPEPSGGLVDLVNLNLAASNLDLGVTGLYYADEAFADGDEAFSLVMGYSRVFSPALAVADEMQLLSPKGPDMVNTCFVTPNRSGQLGTYTTMDVGDSLRFVGDGMRFGLARDPNDYPGTTSNVWLYYITGNTLLTDHPVLDSNWAYDQELEFQWDGGVPPAGAPVASIPVPSWAPDERTGKEAGSPTIYSPPKLEGIVVSASEAETGGEMMVFAPHTDYLPSPLDGSGDVLHVRWNPWDNAEENNSRVVIQVRLLKVEDEGTLLPCPWDPNQECECDDEGPMDLRCDPGYSTDISVGNESGGGIDDCHDGIDNDGDFRCDTGGCICVNNEEEQQCPTWMDGHWMGPDADCGRDYKTKVCRSAGGQNRCFNVGGDRNPDGTSLELTCTVEDEPGHFVISEDYIQEMLGQVDHAEIGGALLIVGRVAEERVRMPMVKDEIGNQVDIGDLRVRVSNVSIGRLAVNLDDE